MEPYQLSCEKVIEQFKSDRNNGLQMHDVVDRQKLYGLNELPEPAKPSFFSLFIKQFKNPLIYILLFTAMLIFLVGEDTIDAIVILVVLLVNASVGMFYENRTYNVLSALKKFAAVQAVVIREGKEAVVDAKQLVPGDIISLMAGDIVPADARIIESYNLQLNEAVLTGESQAVAKGDVLVDDDAVLAERFNMVYKATQVLSGSCIALVVATGKNTQVGKVSVQVAEIDIQTPLKKELDRLSYGILLALLLVGAVLFAIGLVHGYPWYDLFMTLIALGVSVIPEGLPVVMTLVLVRGAYALAEQKILVKNIQAIETLGKIDVILTDKTGTLTRNELCVVALYTPGNWYSVSGSGYHEQGSVMHESGKVANLATAQLGHIMNAGGLLNTAHIIYDTQADLFTITGDPTEAALFVLAKKVGFNQHTAHQEFNFLHEIPFDSASKYHAGFYKQGANGIAYIVAAPEFILKRSGHDTDGAHEALERMLAQGLRVVAVAFKNFALTEVPAEPKAAQSWYATMVEESLNFVALCGMQDAIRPEIAPMIQQLSKTDINVVMVTGDHKKTALYVAKEVGIYQEGDRCLNGSEVDDLSDEELTRQLNWISVFSRMSPDQKHRILKIYQRLGKRVAMTGDGINDTPALVAADVGVSMGHIATEVARQAADLILVNDSFAYLNTAIEYGKQLFLSLRRVLLYLLSTSIAEVLLIITSFAFALPVPLLPAQILWINLVTDGFLDITLAMEPHYKKNIVGSWFKKKQNLLDSSSIKKMIFVAVPMAAGSLWTYVTFMEEGLPLARTMTLVVLALYQWFNAWSYRSEQFSLAHIGFGSNRWIMGATALVVFLQCLLIYNGSFNLFFNTVPLSAGHWLYAIVMTMPLILGEELRKAVVRFYTKKIN